MPNALKAPVNLGNSGIFIDNRLKRDEEDEGDKNMNCISIINVRSLKLSSFDMYEIILPWREYFTAIEKKNCEHDNFKQHNLACLREADLETKLIIWLINLNST